ncbi:MAG: hypothetical protein ACK58X_06890, partial [Planctomycetota bacterium]
SGRHPGRHRDRGGGQAEQQDHAAKAHQVGTGVPARREANGGGAAAARAGRRVQTRAVPPAH